MAFRFSVATWYGAGADPDSFSDAEAKFAPLAARYRGRQQLFLVTTFLGIVLTSLAVFFWDFYGLWMAVPGGVLLTAGMALAFTIPALRCPSCDHELERLVRFCPRCAAEAIEIGVVKGNRCGSCGKGLETTRGRHFPIRYCSRCGELLDRYGV